MLNLTNPFIFQFEFEFCQIRLSDCDKEFDSFISATILTQRFRWHRAYWQVSSYGNYRNVHLIGENQHACTECIYRITSSEEKTKNIVYNLYPGFLQGFCGTMLACATYLEALFKSWHLF